MKTSLLIIDIQNDYFPGGKMEAEGSVEAAANAAKILSSFRAGGLPVAHIQHLSIRPGSTFFLPDTEGVRIYRDVEPLPGEAVFQKYYPNAFRKTFLLDHLRKENVSGLVVCGMMTHMCVDASVRAAFDLGLRCTVISDACATRGLRYQGTTIPAGQVHGAFLAALATVYARVLTTADFLSQPQSS